MAVVVSWAWPQPLLHHVQRNAFINGVNAEAVPQALGAGVGAVRNASCGDDLLDPAKARRAAPGPEQRPGLDAPLYLAQTVHQVEGVEQLGRHRHRPVRPAPALLEALENDHLASQVDPVGGQRQGLGDSAAGGLQHAAEGAHLTRDQGRYRNFPLTGPACELLPRSRVTVIL